MNPEPVIQVDNLWFQLGGRTLFNALSVELRLGVNWIRGPNGIGKTTLLKLLAGAVQPSSGTARYCNISIADLSLAERQQFFYCGDEAPDLPWLTASDFIALYQSLYPAMNTDRLHQYLTAFQIGGISRTPILSLSLGERKKLILAMAFSLDVAVVLIDEPFNALDAAARMAVHEWLVTRAAEQRQIIAITSHLEPQAFNHVIDLERCD